MPTTWNRAGVGGSPLVEHWHATHGSVRPWHLPGLRPRPSTCSTRTSNAGLAVGPPGAVGRAVVVPEGGRRPVERSRDRASVIEAQTSNARGAVIIGASFDTPGGEQGLRRSPRASRTACWPTRTGAVGTAYEVRKDDDEQGADFARRRSFLIDPDGVLRKMYEVPRRGGSPSAGARRPDRPRGLIRPSEPSGRPGTLARRDRQPPSPARAPHAPCATTSSSNPTSKPATFRGERDESRSICIDAGPDSWCSTRPSWRSSGSSRAIARARARSSSTRSSSGSPSRCPRRRGARAAAPW